MSKLFCRLGYVRVWRIQKLGAGPLQGNHFSSLRDIIQGMNASAAGQQETANVAAASKQRLSLAESFKAGSLNLQQAKKSGDKPGEKGLNLSWAQAAAAEQKVKFSVEAGLSSPFVSQRSSGLSSIREAMRKAEEAKTATAAVKLGGGAPVSLIGKLMGARSATPEVVEQPPAVSFHERRAAFEARWADTVKSAPVAAMAAPPTVDRRYERLQVGQERKRTDFDKRMGLEKDWRTPEKSDGSGKGWHRDVNSHKDDSVEISTRKLKRELQQKAGLNRAFQEEEEPAKKVATIREILIPDNGLTVRELASRLSMKIAELTKRLVTMGVLPETGPPGAGKKAAALDQELEQKNDSRIVDADSAELLVLELGLNARRVEDKTAVRAALLADKPSSHTKHDAAVLMPRAPVVCVMGHVDHGKTTLLDTLRKFNHTGAATATTKAEPTEVAGTEAGGITQKLSAFGVEISQGRRVIFLDTPGHAAFSAMRSHGAIATDLVILVVAIDDGVRPQTIEALRMAKEAGCSIIIVLNKVDKIPVAERPATRQRVLAQLLNHDLIAEEFGGEVQVAEVAARTGEGIPALMDSLLLQAEVLELQAAISGQAEAVVLDASVVRGKGVVAEVLVRWGALNVGDPIVVGGSYGKVKSMFNDRGESVQTAMPSDAVRLQGLRALPVSGQEMLSVESETIAKEIADRRLAEVEARRVREQELIVRRLEMKARLEAAAAAEAAGEVGAKAKVAAAFAPKPVKIDVVIKADGVGTLEALKKVVQGIASRAMKDVRVEVVGATVGDVNLNDVELAAAGEDSLVLAFNVGVVDAETRSKAKMLDVNICRSDIIYRLEDELVRVMLANLPKERTLEREGIAKVLKVFKFNGGKGQVVAGLQVESGKMRTKASHNSNSGNAGDANANAGGFVFRVLRNGKEVLKESRGDSELKRLKATVHEVESGVECGLTLSNFSAFEEGDEIECLKVVWTAPTQVVLEGDSGTVREKSAEEKQAEAEAADAAAKIAEAALNTKKVSMNSEEGKAAAKVARRQKYR